MPIIWLFVIAFVAGVIMMIVEFVQAVAEGIDARVADIGGWYVAAAFGAGLILLFVVLVRSGKRSERRDLLRAIPHQIDSRIAQAAAKYRRAAEALNQAVAERDAKRAPLFWDQIEAAATALMECAETLVETDRMIDRYNDKAPGHKLKIPKLDPVPSLALSRTLDLMGEMERIAQDALAIPVFAGVYEQRRATAQLGELQALANQEFMTTLEQIREEAERTADSAERARRASKRAAGDWF